jgi:cytochrome P450
VNCVAEALEPGHLVASTSLAELERDPYPLYAAMRAHKPVAYVPAANQWLISRYEDVQWLGNHPELFTAELQDSPQEAAFGKPTILTVDGPVHLDLRSAVDGTLRPSRVRKSAPSIVEPIISRQLDALSASDEADLMVDYFEPVSVATLGEVLGLGHVPVPTLKRWYQGLSEGAVNFEKDPERSRICAAVAAELDAEVEPLLADPSRCPAHSLIPNLISGGLPEGARREADAVLPSLKVTLFAGMQEPAAGGAVAMHGLLQNPDQFEDVRMAPEELVPSAVEEALRWISPVGTQTRETTQDVELGGVTIPAGTMIGTALASANRDVAQFGESAHLFDIHRKAPAQVAFGVGLHHCAGHALARLQMTEAVTRLLEAFPEIALDTTRSPTYRGWEFRSPTTLPVVLGTRKA